MVPTVITEAPLFRALLGRDGAVVVEEVSHRVLMTQAPDSRSFRAVCLMSEVHFWERFVPAVADVMRSVALPGAPL